MFQKAISIILALFTLFLTVLGSLQSAFQKATDTQTPVPASETAPVSATVKILKINKHGTLILDISFDEMYALGIEAGDIITVQVGDLSYDLPVGNSYTDVDSGEMICRLDLEDREVGLAINMGSFADATGIAVKQTIEEDPGYLWEIKTNEVSLFLKEKNGYLDEFTMRNLVRTDNRTDYPELSDEEFANFREVAVSGLKEKTLYRSSTPISPSIGRNEYAMEAMEKAGVRTVINLGDSVNAMQSYETFPDSYYSRCAVVNPEMGYDFDTEEFAGKVKESVLFITENDGPYLIHCKEGKDRTGILCALLECFVGARAEQVKEDYMITYLNYYGVRPQDASYEIILKNNLIKILCGLFEIDTIESTDLKDAAERYLLSIGLTEEQLLRLGEKLIKE